MGWDRRSALRFDLRPSSGFPPGRLRVGMSFGLLSAARPEFAKIGAVLIASQVLFSCYQIEA